MSTVLRRFALAALAGLALVLPSLADAAASVTGMQLVSTVRFDRTKYDYTYAITVANVSPALTAAKATVVSSAPATQIIKGTVDLGNLAAGATVTSVDTFTLRQDRTFSFNPASLAWTVTGGAPTGNATLEIALSDPVVAPSGSVTVTPTLRDGNGNVISNAGYQFTIAVAAVGQVFGNAPVVAGLTVSFPKIAKAKLSSNPTLDPAGDFADTNPADPSYGKETGGIYRITVGVVSLSLTSSVNVTVLPTGSAQITVAASQYAGKLGNALAIAVKARQTSDPVLLAQAAAALVAVDANADFSSTVLKVNSALAPPDGGPITPAQLAARGFIGSAQDPAFASAVANVVAKVRAARLQVDATNVLALTQVSVDALQAAANGYTSASQALQGLRASTLGSYQQQDAINQAIGIELPALLDSIKTKSGQLLGVTTHASSGGVPHYAYATRPDRASLALSEFDVSPRPAFDLGSARAIDLTPRPSDLMRPDAMYAGTQRTQFIDFIGTTFSIFTSLSGAALGNIIELSFTLANSILNIELNNYVNQGAASNFGIDYCLASSSLVFVCPNYIPSRIGGYGFGRDPGAIGVILVGCVDAALLKNLLTLRKPNDIAAGIRLLSKVNSVANSTSRDQGSVAFVTPDSIRDDEIFGDSQDMLYFAGGFPRVNQGRLPCVGVVIVQNTRLGGIASVALNFLAQCG